jgi:hypothetical protein
MPAPAAPAQPATLFARYLAHCEEDAAVLLARVCRDAAAPQSGGGVWLAPVQRKAREVLPTLAPGWMVQLARLARPQSSQPNPTSPGNAFVVSGFGVPSGLSLMSDDDVDEDIESTRLVQAIESTAEWSLRDLRSRLASAPLPPGSHAREDVLPLAPAKVVGALCAALHEQGFEPALRLAVMRAAADPLSKDLATLYQRHGELLADWGVQPARYTIRREPELRPSTPAATSAGPAAGAVGVATAQIPALLARVAGEAGLSGGMQDLMTRLASPVARSVAADQRLLESMDNPLWRLIDRLAALGQLDTAAAPGGLQLPLHLRLEPIIARLEQSAQPLPAQRYAQALAEAEAEALGVADSTTAPATLRAIGSHAMEDFVGSATTGLTPTPAPAPAPARALNERALAAQESRQALEPLVRGQMVARLREVPVLPEVKQFLLGPWLDVVTQVLALKGEDSPDAQRVLGVVESLIDAGSHHRRVPLTPAELTCLRMEAEDGLLADSPLPKERVRQHVDDLSEALAMWPRPAPDTGLLAEGLLEQAEPALPDWPSHDELATVPIALDAHNPDERAMRDCEAWLDSLAVGDVCRLQRQGQWATLRLNWRNDPGTYFAFGNATGLAFCVSRRVLGRLRLEGLATTMARGQWLRRAVDTLPMSLE